MLLKLNATRVYLVMTTTQTLTDVLGFILFIYFYVVELHLSPLELVLAGTALELTKLVFEVPTGVLADNVSRRLSLIIGAGLMGVSTLGQSFSTDFTLVAICQAVRGFAYTFINGADKAWLVDEAGEDAVGPTLLLSSQLGQVISVVGLAGSVGLSLINLRLPFVASGLISLGLMIFLIVAMPERNFVRPTRTARVGFGSMFKTFRAGLGVVRQSTILILFLAIALFAGLSEEGYDRLWKGYLVTNFAFPSLFDWPPVVWLGLISLSGMVLSFAALHMMRRRLDMSNRGLIGRLLWLTHGASLLGCFVVALGGSFEVVVLAAIVRDVIRTVSRPLIDTWLTLSIPSHVRATVLSISSQVNAFGEVVGGPFIGALGNAYGTRLALVITGFLTLPNLVLYLRLTAQARLTQPEREGVTIGPPD